MHKQMHSDVVSNKKTTILNGRGSFAAAMVVLAAILTACTGGEPGAGKAANGQDAAALAPLPSVGVVVVKKDTVSVVTELPGRVEASRIAQVRARVSGILMQRLFEEGSDVKAGQLLFRIDAAPYAAALQSAKASWARAEANLAQTQALLARYRPLVVSNAISQLEFDNANAAYKAAQADVAVAKAAVRTAEINTGYADVSAPIAGRIGRALVTEGALVGQGEATRLAVGQQINPVYVNFTQSSAEVLNLRRDLESGKLQRAEGEEAASVNIILEDGSKYEETGRLLFTDLTVEASTGQVTLRAEVPNNRGILLPGMFVRVRLEQAQLENAIAVPQQAVVRSRQGDTLTVVDAEGGRSVRPVTVGTAWRNQWLILDGLSEGEMVMVDGFQRLQMMPPGIKVEPVPWRAEETDAAPTVQQQ